MLRPRSRPYLIQYERSLRPCLAHPHRAQATRPHPETGSPRTGSKRSGAVNAAGKRASQDAFEPLGDPDERTEVDSGLNPFTVEQVGKILRRHVARRAGGKGTAAQPAQRGLEGSHAGLERRVGVRYAGVPSVMEV